MSSLSKKRKAEAEADDKSRHVELASPEGSTRGNKKVSKRPSHPRSDTFLRNKDTLFQQGVERNNRLLEGYMDELKRKNDDANPAFCGPMIQYKISHDILKDLYDGTPGLVVTMGQDDTGQLGLANRSEESKEEDDESKEKEGTNPPTLVPRLMLQNIVQLDAGGLHTGAVSHDGRVFTFGCNDDGALARGTTTDLEEYLPTVVEGFHRSKYAMAKARDTTPLIEDGQMVKVAAGTSHTLFLTIHGNVYMSGMYKLDSDKFSDERPKDDAIAETGIGGIRKSPVHVWQMPQAIRYISSQGSFSAAIGVDNSSVYTWGIATSGELARPVTKLERNGDGEWPKDTIANEYLKPSPVAWEGPPLKRTVLHVACGSFHILVTARDPGQFDSVLYSAGSNTYGQLGHGDDKDRDKLTPVVALKESALSGGIVKIAAGQFHSLALNALGTALYAFGRGDYGQLGLLSSYEEKDPKKKHANIPSRVPFPAPVQISDIAAGDHASFAITCDGSLYSWGTGQYGPTGHNWSEDNDVSLPKRLDVLWKLRAAGEPADCHVLRACGGGQHSALLIKRFN